MGRTAKLIDIGIWVASMVVHMKELVRMELLKEFHGIRMSMHEDNIGEDIPIVKDTYRHLMSIARSINGHRGFVLVERFHQVHGSRYGTRSKSCLGAHDIPDSILDRIIKECASG